MLGRKGGCSVLRVGRRRVLLRGRKSANLIEKGVGRLKSKSAGGKGS
jgi:hypothetical protein